MSSHEKLSAAANDRKSRLAQLKSLKRKQPPASDDHSDDTSLQEQPSTALVRTEPEDEEPSVTATYLSGRNYDPETRNVKLGFDNIPIGDPTATLEHKAQQLALESRTQQAAESVDDKSLDIFKLQPKKPNWDLKRDLEQKTRTLDVQTENAIAKLVRERIEAQKLEQKKRLVAKDGGAEGEEVGIEGTELVEAMNLKEQEEERDRKRDEEDEDVS
ncbi:hypothetical protein IQ07DRAFT_88192 [Pyrenochaeta sp. DS3sAY3a]|nr:hypothetical protein IQ07DRAFT_88192 [Pyrenochaeta sp. DS3sAY3a]